MAEPLYFPDTNRIRLSALREKGTQTYINNATVTFTLLDSEGVVITGPTAVPYVASSNGNYEIAAFNTSALGIAIGDDVTGQYDVTTTDARVGRKTVSLVVQSR